MFRIIFVAIILINIVATSLHCLSIFFDKNSEQNLSKWIVCFSMIENIGYLFDLNHNDSKRFDSNSNGKKQRRRFRCLDVVRLMLVINVCIDHMFLFPPFMSFMSFKRILNSVITKVYYYNKYFFARNIFIIDALFLIRFDNLMLLFTGLFISVMFRFSGLLLSYSLLRKLSLNQGRLHFWIFLLRLWLKYSVPMFFVVLIFWLLPRTGDGPLWKFGMRMLLSACKEPDSLLYSFTYLSNYRIKSNQNIFNFDQKFAVVNNTF